MAIETPRTKRPNIPAAPAAARSLGLALLLLGALIWTGPAAPGKALAGAPVLQNTDPAPRTVVAMAQHLVREQFMDGPLGFHRIQFNPAQLHPQDEPNFWAVVGAFVSDRTVPNTYVAAVRMICPDPQEVKCWRLDALAINDQIVLKRGFDL